MRHPIPAAALDDRLGFIGTSGSGKTYNAGTAIEILLNNHRTRAVIIDPLGVWWGLRLLADGKKPSNFNVVIFGGDHADLPLNEQAGALIGETAATMAESCIIDLSKLPSRSAERRFMTAFLETIYRKAGGEPFHLVVDEADLFAPQKPQKGDEVLLGHMENIVRRGRVRGFVPWLISQRPAVLNKNVLSQVDGLLAFKLTASQDRDALDAWIEGQADKAQGKAIKDALPTFPVGEGIVWLPSHGILERKPFPPKVTFDSSRKPKRGEKLKSRKLKTLNLDKLKEQLAAFVEQQKSNDVPTLKKRIAELEAAAKRAPARAPAAKPDKDAIGAAEARGFEKAKRQFGPAADRAFHLAIKQSHALVGERLAAMKREVDEVLVKSRQELANPSSLIEFKSSPPAAEKRKLVVTKNTPTEYRAHVPPANVAGDGSLSGPQTELLASLAWWVAMGHDQPSKAQVAAVANWKVKGSHLRNRLAELVGKGLITYPRSGLVQLTAEGAAIAPVADTSQALIQRIEAMLTGPQREVFSAMLQHPEDTWSRQNLAEALNWEAGGSHLRNRLAELSAMEIIGYPSKGEVALQGWVVE